MMLVAQTTQGSAHGDHVVIRMRTEHDHLFRIRGGTLRTIRIVSVRLTARPSCDRMLDIVEYFDIYIIRRTIEGQQLAQSVLAIILVCQFQDRFVRQLTQPNDRTADQLIIPLAASHQPRMADSGQIVSGGKIDHDLGVRMIL